MNRAGIIALTVFIPLFLAGCSEWKETIQTKKQTDELYAGMIIDKDHALAVGLADATRFSLDGGKHWRSGMTTKDHRYSLYGCFAPDENNFYATGNKRQVFVSSNAGDTWTVASDIGAEAGKSLSFFAPESGWVSAKAWLGETADRGKKWTALRIPAGVSSIETVCAIGPGSGYLVSETKDIYRTTDSGAHWEKLSSPFTGLTVPFQPYFCLAAQGVALSMNGDSGILACSGKVNEKFTLMISETKDGGKTWSKPELHALKLQPKSVGVSSKGYVSVFNKDLSLIGFTK
ncbi:MAG TPA: YCF48-related protein [Treponemataceae bacterium]|nr:YCF48-related protein [Treponemataceae bacterium]